MTNNDYKQAAEKILGLAATIENLKRPAYTQGSPDVLKNFKAVAERMGITTRQAWGVYALKHFDAICSWAKNPNIPQGEALEGRFCDAINYLKLGYAIFAEETAEAMEPLKK